MQWLAILSICFLAWAITDPSAALALLARWKDQLRDWVATREGRADYEAIAAWFEANNHTIPPDKARLIRQALHKHKAEFLALLIEKQAERYEQENT